MPRIVSLIASATEIVHALGLGDRQVGRSHECDYPEVVRHLPVCTMPAFAVDGDSAEIDRLVKEKLKSAVSIYQVFEDVLERLQPTHIITQTQCRVCAVSLEDVERALSRSLTSRPAVVALEPNALADVWADIHRVASACGVPEAGCSLVRTLQARMDEISARALADGPQPRVACIEWIEPLMAAGNWIPELVERAGGVNVLGEAGKHSPFIDWERLRAADPEVVIVAPCGFDLARAKSEMYWMEQRPGWADLRAVRAGQVYVIDGNQFMTRPGPRVVESLRILAEILHPRAFEPSLRILGWSK